MVSARSGVGSIPILGVFNDRDGVVLGSDNVETFVEREPGTFDKLTVRVQDFWGRPRNRPGQVPCRQAAIFEGFESDRRCQTGFVLHRNSPCWSGFGHECHHFEAMTFTGALYKPLQELPPAVQASNS